MTVRGEESDDAEPEDAGSTHRRRDRDGETGVAQAFRPAIARLKPCATTRSEEKSIRSRIGVQVQLA